MHGGFALTFLHMQIKLTTMLFKLCNLQNAYYYQLSLASTALPVSEVAVLHLRYAGVFASIVSICSALENGRYGNASIRVFLALVYQSLAILDQAGGLENAAYTQLVAHADH